MFKALRYGSRKFTYTLHHTCLYFVSVHQMAPPLIGVADILLQLTTHLSTPTGWNAELAWLADILRTVYPDKWSPDSCKSSADWESWPVKDRRSTTVPCNQSQRSYFRRHVNSAQYL